MSHQRSFLPAVANGLEAKLIECPYNKYHQILPDRMQRHLIRCRQSYPDEKKVQCPYNSTHVVGQCEYEYHVEHCSNMKSLVNHLIQYDNKQTYFEPVPIINQDIECSENWDTVNVPTYDPTEHLESNTILRNKQGCPPSERRAFRANERRRIGALIEQQRNVPTNRSENSSLDTSKITVLRRPNSVSVTKKAAAASGIWNNEENQSINNPHVVTKSSEYDGSDYQCDVDLSKQFSNVSISNKNDFANSKKSNLVPTRGRKKRNMTNNN